LVQNCTVLADDTNPSTCWKASRVQARLPAVRASKRQLRSLIALAAAWDPPNVGGSTAGTPPIIGGGPLSQTLALPLPSGLEVMI
jgi:hypothetical protein